MDIGSHNEISPSISYERLIQSIKTYEKETGNKILEHIPYSDEDSIMKRMIEYSAWVRKQDFDLQPTIFFPYSGEDFLDNTEGYSIYCGDLDSFDDIYLLICFHTHPSSRPSFAFPSLDDLISINRNRRINQEETGIPLSPIGIVATQDIDETSETSVVYLSVYQEKTRQPLDENEIAEVYGSLINLSLRDPYSYQYLVYDLDKRKIYSDYRRNFKFEIRP